jgi:hypothetical protein
MARTMMDLAKEALAVQDACNLSGVAQSFARAMSALRDLGLDTRGCNEHPITIIWLDKMNGLAGIQNLGDTRVMAAFREVSKIAGEAL